jgi:hypothetical protein
LQGISTLKNRMNLQSFSHKQVLRTAAAAQALTNIAVPKILALLKIPSCYTMESSEEMP